jgi:hypothetical protein
VLRGKADLPPAWCTAGAGLLMLAYLAKQSHHLKSIEFKHA